MVQADHSQLKNIYSFSIFSQPWPESALKSLDFYLISFKFVKQMCTAVSHPFAGLLVGVPVELIHVFLDK